MCVCVCGGGGGGGVIMTFVHYQTFINCPYLIGLRQKLMYDTAGKNKTLFPSKTTTKDLIAIISMKNSVNL